MAGWSYTFEGVSATNFNFVSDVLGVLLRTVFAFVIGDAFAHLMSRHLRRGNSIPAEALGQVPSDFVASCRLAWMLRLSGPAVALAILLALADFSHSVADLGLSFTAVDMEGPLETVLDLEQRNPTRLLQLSGDPASSRTRPLPDSSVAAARAGYVDRTQARLDTRLIQSFLLTSDDVAGGGSAFASYSDGDRWDVSYYGTEASVYFDPELPLARMALQLPLHCNSSSLRAVPQTIRENDLPGYDGPRFVPLKNTPLLPDCSYGAPRASGIHNNRTTVDHADVLEYMFTYYPDAGNTPNLALDQDGSLVQTVILTPAERKLARDRDDWSRGRAVPSIRGVQFANEQLTVRFQSTVLATVDYGPQQVRDGDNGEVEFYQTRTYFLVSSVEGECPPRPSGRAVADCLVLTEIYCDPSLPEDVEAFGPSDFENPNEVPFLGLYPPKEDISCRLQGTNIIWGRNFGAVDDDFVAVVSAVLTRSQVNPFDVFELRAVLQNSPLAALFAMSSTGELPSIEPQVNPQINLLFVCFMMVPLYVSAAIYAFIYKRPKLPVPTNGWQLVMLGREEDVVPQREGKESEFPQELSKKYIYAIRTDTSQRTLEERLGIYESNQ